MSFSFCLISFLLENGEYAKRKHEKGNWSSINFCHQTLLTSDRLPLKLLFFSEKNCFQIQRTFKREEYLPFEEYSRRGNTYGVFFWALLNPMSRWISSFEYLAILNTFEHPTLFTTVIGRTAPLLSVHRQYTWESSLFNVCLPNSFEFCTKYITWRTNLLVWQGRSSVKRSRCKV